MASEPDSNKVLKARRAEIEDEGPQKQKRGFRDLLGADYGLFTPSQWFGSVCAWIGALMMLYYFIVYDPTVELVPSKPSPNAGAGRRVSGRDLYDEIAEGIAQSGANQKPEKERVVNFSRSHHKQNGIIVGASIMIGGTIVLVGGRRVLSESRN